MPHVSEGFLIGKQAAGFAFPQLQSASSTRVKPLSVNLVALGIYGLLG
ncbi:MAG TPA: hypothetical protein VJ935_00805 [Acidimicrobiia bacterium]|nr:hypothetical protein [Acidimicrobiia bacterium]